MDDHELVDVAREATGNAHVPYSEYRVGASLLTADGTVFTGCNIENANYSNSLHAEEVAIAEAVKNDHHDFVAIAVSSSARDGVTPCGMCRQTLAEFCDEDFPVYCDEGENEDGTEEISEYALGDLLPNTISLDTLEAARSERQ
ncbi:cytidine deaminase [Halobacteriales archaeon QH_6_64_20]|jgi:cytidine deaminase|nr:MAG: cytidine deaminase [Halobacteriales archaeon QH_6_64_20]